MAFPRLGVAHDAPDNAPGSVAYGVVIGVARTVMALAGAGEGQSVWHSPQNLLALCGRGHFGGADVPAA